MTTAQEKDKEKSLKDQSKEGKTIYRKNVLSLRIDDVKAERRVTFSRESSEQEHRVDAKAPSAEEGRGKLRKARGSRKQA